MNEKNSTFFKTYFILIMGWAVVGLIDSFFITGSKETFGQINMAYALLISLFESAIFILSIFALVIFIKDKFSKITLILPIYHLVAAILIFMYGLIWGITSVIQSNPITIQSIPSGLIVMGIISSLFEFIFSWYILYKYKFPPQQAAGYKK